MSRPRRSPSMTIEPDPLAEAVFIDTQGLAGELEAVLESVKGYDQEAVHGIVFRKPPGGFGKFEWVERIGAPINLDLISASLKARYGGGDYRVSIFAAGKLRKNIEFPIMSEPKPPADLLAGQGGSDRLMMMMMNMQAEARRDSQEQQRFMAEQQRHRDAQMMTMLGVVVPVVAPLLFGGREKLTDLLAMMQANKPEANNLKDTVETLVAVKGLLGDNSKDGPDFNPDDVVGSIARLAGPIMGAAGRAFAGGRGAGPPADQVAEPAQGDGQLFLPHAPRALPPAPTLPPSTGNAVLDLIRPHVLYFFSARLDPGLAAEAIADIMAREGVAEEDVHGLVAAFAVSTDWQTDLAAQGIDLRGEPEWAEQFLRELVAAWSEGEPTGDGGTGGDGGLADAPGDAGPGAAGLALNGHPGPGAGADN